MAIDWMKIPYAETLILINYVTPHWTYLVGLCLCTIKTLIVIMRVQMTR